jgi:hypothetical protein
MAVPAAERWLFQHRQGQDLAEGNNNAEVSFKGRQLLLAILITLDPLWSEHRNTQLECPFFDG